MSCGLDQACISQDIKATMNRLSNGPGFDGLERGIASMRRVESGGVLDRADVTFLIDNCPNIAGWMRGMVVNGFIDHLDTNHDGKITRAEFDAGSSDQLEAPRRNGVQLRR
jgi:hypothetical protein